MTDNTSQNVPYDVHRATKSSSCGIATSALGNADLDGFKSIHYDTCSVKGLKLDRRLSRADQRWHDRHLKPSTNLSLVPCHTCLTKLSYWVHCVESVAFRPFLLLYAGDSLSRDPVAIICGGELEERGDPTAYSTQCSALITSWRGQYHQDNLLASEVES